jgi:hypothetical protein
MHAPKPNRFHRLLKSRRSGCRRRGIRLVVDWTEHGQATHRQPTMDHGKPSARRSRAISGRLLQSWAGLLSNSGLRPTYVTVRWHEPAQVGLVRRRRPVVGSQTKQQSQFFKKTNKLNGMQATTSSFGSFTVVWLLHSPVYTCTQSTVGRCSTAYIQ